MRFSLWQTVMLLTAAAQVIDAEPRPEPSEPPEQPPPPEPKQPPESEIIPSVWGGRPTKAKSREWRPKKPKTQADFDNLQKAEARRQRRKDKGKTHG